MKIFKTLLLFFFIIQLQANNNEEFRATWSITWHQFSSSLNADDLKARTRKIIDNHKEANMNAVLWHVRQGGTVYYPSVYEPWGSYIGSSDPGYDPLEYAIEYAHSQGMELHAWFNTFQVSSTVSGTIAAEHPDWICRDENGILMTESRAASPGLKAVRDYTLNVAMEIVNNYDVDGIHFDYVRWNEYSNSKGSKALAVIAEKENRQDGQWSEEEIDILTSTKSGRYLYDLEHPKSGGVPSGYSTWEDYWRSSVTQFVQAVHDSVQMVKPWVRVSVASLGNYKAGGWNGYYSVFQDAALWFNIGSIDQLTPMHYHWSTADAFEYMLTGYDGWKTYISTGIAAKRLYTVGPGSYNFGSNWKNHPSIVNRLRGISWVDGFQFFSYGSWDGNTYWNEAGQTFFADKTKIRAIPGMAKKSPSAAPSLTITEISNMEYELTITPDPSVSEGQWFILYRGTPELGTIGIEQIFFSDSTFCYNFIVDGYQNFQGVQFFSVSIADRFWNESEKSNLVSTKYIVSKPPIVQDHFPAASEVIPLDKSFEFTFSKTMDKDAFESNFSISPNITVADFSWEKDGWTDGNKKVSITFSEVLNLSTTYTITLPALVSDILGNAIDGNADGTGGDAYSFTFSTMTPDKTAPTVNSSHPEEGYTNFDQDDVINITFSELIDEASLDSATIQLSSGGITVNTESLLMDFEDFSVLSLKSDTILNASEIYNLKISGLTDTASNVMDSYNLNFTCGNNAYLSSQSIDNLSITQGWWDPEGSGSTSGTVGAETSFGYSSTPHLPGSGLTKSAYIRYKWAGENGLLRDHNGGNPASKEITPDKVMQVYVYGDGSGTEFAFSLYEKNSSDAYTADVIECSKWIPVTWTGWRLISWDLQDPDQVGDFISTNENIDGAVYKLDGLLLRQTENSATSGRIYFSQLRAVERANIVEHYVGIENLSELATLFNLKQNYPNPFNPSTTISFNLNTSELTRLDIFDLRGRLIQTIVNEILPSGSYHFQINMNGKSSGIYIYRLQSGMQSQSKRMIFMK